MKENYTSTEARAALQVDAKTFLRWLAQGNVKPQVSKSDNRIKLFTHEQVAQLASDHGRILVAEQEESKVIHHPSVEARLEALEHQLEGIQATLARLTLGTSHHSTTDDKALRNVSQRVVSASSTLPDEWVPINDLIKQYNAPRSTAIRHMKPFIHTGKWRVNGHEVTNALDKDGIAEFMRLFGNPE